MDEERQPDDSERPADVTHWKHVSAAAPRSVGEQVPTFVPTLHDIALPPAKRETMVAMVAMVARFIRNETSKTIDQSMVLHIT